MAHINLMDALKRSPKKSLGWTDKEIRRLAQVAQREGFRAKDDKTIDDLLAIRDLLYDVAANRHRDGRASNPR
jgi:hypothetical protein